MKRFLKKTAAFAVCCLLLAACEDRREVEVLQKQTEDIHDAAMREMAEMNRIGRALKKDTLGSPARRDSIASALLKMTQAEADMMAWMTGYKSPADRPVAEAVQYLQEQKTLIEKNQTDLHTALEAGKSLTKQ